jgi:hypothetical protein
MEITELSPAQLAIINGIDEAIKQFAPAKLASSDQLVNVLLDIRQAALEL